MINSKLKTLSVWALFLVIALFASCLFGIAELDASASMSMSLLPVAFGTIVVGSRQLKMFDWSKAKDVGSMEELKTLICDAFNQYLKSFSDQPLQAEKLFSEKFTGADSNLYGQAPVILVHSDQPKMPDRGYELLFDLVDMKSSTNKSFDILDVSGGVTFFQQIEGEEAKLSEIPSSAKTPCSMLRFTGGFPVLDDWIKYNEHYKIDQLAADTVRNWYKKKATIMYGLLVALTGITENFATDDMTTINNACANILVDLDAAGYAVDESASFVITCNPKLRARLAKALAVTYMTPLGADQTGANKVEFNVSGIVSTSKITDATTYYVSLPGYKNLRGEWEDLNTRPPQRNELKLGADHVSTGAYNGIIGQKLQHKKCALS